MSLETATFVANLVVSNPDGSDQRNTADEHLRLIKAALVRTFPKMDGAVSLSAAQVMYLNDLSASVQLQLNQLRDGPATANYAVNARFANSASVAANIGSIPAARVPDLAATNVFTAGVPLKLQSGDASIDWYKANGSARVGLIQMVDSAAAYIVAEQNIPLALYTNNILRMIIGADGVTTFNFPVVGTISNATLAATATNATNATTATSANTAAFATSAGSSALLSGLSPSDTGGGNTIVQRNSSGYIFGSYFNQSSSIGEAGTVDSFITTQGDNYFRKVTPAQAGAQLSAQNITGRTGIAKTLSSSTPSGGSNGDIWYQY